MELRTQKSISPEIYLLEVIRTEIHFSNHLVQLGKNLYYGLPNVQFALKVNFQEFQNISQGLQRYQNEYNELAKIVLNPRLFHPIQDLKQRCSSLRIRLYEVLFKVLEDLPQIGFESQVSKEMSASLDQMNLIINGASMSANWQLIYQQFEQKFRLQWGQLIKKVLLHNLKHIQIENYLRSILLEKLSQCFERILFWLPSNSHARFQEFREAFTRDDANFSRMHKAAQQPFDEELVYQTAFQYRESHRGSSELVSFIMDFFNLMQSELNVRQDEEDDNLHPVALHKANWLRSIREVITSLEVAQKTIVSLHIPTWEIDSQAACGQLQKAWELFLTKLVEIQKKSVEVASMQMLQRKDFSAKCQMSEPDFRWCKYRQHQIRALEQWLCEPDRILGDFKLQPALVTDWLNKTDYSDLLFLLQVVEPQYIEGCLERKIAFHKELLQKALDQAKILITYWGPQASTIIRLFRTTQFYESWKVFMESKVKALRLCKNPDWSTLFSLYCLLSYDKKAFFTSLVSKESVILLFQVLLERIKRNPELQDPNSAYLNFAKEKQSLQEKLEQQKNDLTQDHRLLQKVAVFLGLAISQQPSFKIAMAGFDVSMDSIDYFEKKNPQAAQTIQQTIDQIGNKIVPLWIQRRLNPQRDTQVLQYLTGLCCFCVDQSVSSWLGFTYRSIAALNRVLFSQFDSWVSMGQKLENYFVPFFEQLLNSVPQGCHHMLYTMSSYFRFDEIGLLEKENMLHWCSGLGLNLLLQGGHYTVATICGYTAASVMMNVSSKMLDEVSKRRDIDAKTMMIAKFAVHVSLYSSAYSIGFSMGHSAFAPPYEGMTYMKALKVFGFYRQPSLPDLRKRYYQLAREYHPDTSPYDCDELSDCPQTNDEKIREINEAYGYLKKY